MNLQFQKDPHLKKIAERTLRSHRKTRVEFTRYIKGGHRTTGIAYYLDNYIVIMKNGTTDPSIDDAFRVFYNKRINKQPDGTPMPLQNDFIISEHGQERSRERSILADEIYETILMGIPMDMSQKEGERKFKYLKDDIAVVVSWEATGVIITEMSLSPTRRKGFIDQIPLLFEDLKGAGLKWGGLTVLDKTTLLMMMSNRFLNPLIYRANDWFRIGLDKFTKEELEQIKPHLQVASMLQKMHEVYDYNTVDGETLRGQVHPGHTYEAVFFAPSLNDKQKKVLDKWGLTLKKAEDGEIPSFVFKPISKDRPVPNVEAYLFDMSQFSGNAHTWFFPRKPCKLTNM